MSYFIIYNRTASVSKIVSVSFFLKNVYIFHSVLSPWNFVVVDKSLTRQTRVTNKFIFVILEFLSYKYQRDLSILFSLTESNIRYIINFVLKNKTSRCGASDSVTDSSVLSNPVTPRIFPVWDFVVGIFARKALLNSGRVFSTLSCWYLYK